MDESIKNLYIVAKRKADLLHQFSEIYKKPAQIIKTGRKGRPKLDLTDDERIEHNKEITRLARLKHHEKMKKRRAMESIRHKFTCLDYNEQVMIVNELIKLISLT